MGDYDPSILKHRRHSDCGCGGHHRRLKRHHCDPHLRRRRRHGSDRDCD